MKEQDTKFKEIDNNCNEVFGEVEALPNSDGYNNDSNATVISNAVDFNFLVKACTDGFYNLIGQMRKENRWKNSQKKHIDSLEKEIGLMIEVLEEKIKPLCNQQFNQHSDINEDRNEKSQDCTELRNELDECRTKLAMVENDFKAAQKNLESLKADERSRKVKLARLERQTNIKDLLEDGLLRFLTDVHHKTENATDLQKLKEDIFDIEQVVIDDLRFHKIEILSHGSNDHIDKDEYRLIEAVTVPTDNKALDHCVQTSCCYGAILKGETEKQDEIIKEKLVLYIKN